MVKLLQLPVWAGELADVERRVADSYLDIQRGSTWVPGLQFIQPLAALFFPARFAVAKQPIPAAQYVRMSTEHQQYSLTNQSAAIQLYAVTHGFEITKTYSDAAKSGLSFRSRAGLRQLLEDVVRGNLACNAILVYDISRWGRFQDTDESAYYEFLCKSSGVPVHYCAEPFNNDLAATNLLMKALKRSMAGEYSRDLSTRVSAGQKRLSSLGFKQGGIAGYGLRRMLISHDGTRNKYWGIKNGKVSRLTK